MERTDRTMRGGIIVGLWLVASVTLATAAAIEMTCAEQSALRADS